MNINAGNPSLENIITRTLMGKKEKRPSFQEVFNKLSKNSAMMNTRMPLNSSLTNEQMYRCYVQNTMPKLQKSNDTFGESELNTVLMRLLGNENSGNALSTTPLATAGATTGGTVPLPATGVASLATLPLGTPTVLPTAPVSAPVPTPVPTVAPVLAPAPTTPMPSLIPIVTAVTPLMPSLIPIVTAVTPLMPLNIPPMGSVSTPPPSPIVATAQNIGGAVVGAIAALFPPNPNIPGLVTTPQPAQTPVLPAGTAGAALTSNPTIQPTAEELAEELAKLQLAAAANQPDPSLVINKPVRGRPPDESDDPVVKSIQEALSDIYLLKKKVKTEDLNADEIKQLKNLTKLTNAYYSSKTAEKRKIDEDAAELSAETPEPAGAAGGAGRGTGGGRGKGKKKK